MIKEYFSKIFNKYSRDNLAINYGKKCRNCINYNTLECPNSFDCYAKDDKPFFKLRGVRNDNNRKY